VLERKEQAILFLNRRGFAPSLVCEACGTIAECPNCSVALTLHRARRPRLVCHHCDYSAPSPDVCEACKSPQLADEGVGTERVEAALTALFPSARVARLDRDVAAGLKSEEVLARMRRGEIDILVGTQMVTKGHDLPNVTLVGVLNADSVLSLPDYQASERTFHQLVQVAGRAGRGDAPGSVLIQTRNPEHPAVRCAKNHDVVAFVTHELAERKELRYPPYARLAMVRIDATEEAVARQGAEQLAAVARQAAGTDAEVLGPSPAPIARVRNRFRFRFLLRARTRAALRPALLAVARTSVDRRLHVQWDVDPVNML
jgi:primosomal protein N' (replication factor Y)